MPDLERLAQLQIELATWQCRLREIWDDGPERRQMAETAQSRSNEVLEMSGLLVETVPNEMSRFLPQVSV